jgi:hypothetical protein
MKYIVQVSDCDGNACRIRLNLPLVKSNATTTNSSWSVMDEGWLKYRSGGCNMYNNDDSGDLWLCVGKSWTLGLNEFIDSWTTANDSGSGLVYVQYCVNFRSGNITWALIS